MREGSTKKAPPARSKTLNVVTGCVFASGIPAGCSRWGYIPLKGFSGISRQAWGCPSANPELLPASASDAEARRVTGIRPQGDEKMHRMGSCGLISR